MPADYQRRLTVEAPMRAAARDRELWIAARDRMRAELELLTAHRFTRDVSSDLRVLERQLERIDERIKRV